MSKRIKTGIFLLFFLFPFMQKANAIQKREIVSYGVSYKLLSLINKPVAVIPFRNISGVTVATDDLTDKFTIFLVKSNLFNVIERDRLQELFNEQEKYGLSGKFDDSSMAKAGRILGAAAIFIGTIYEYDPYVPGFFIFAKAPVVRIGVRLVNTETGETLWSAEDKFNGFDRSVQKLVPQPQRWRVRTDVDFLSSLLCKQLVNTLLDTYKKQFVLKPMKSDLLTKTMANAQVKNRSRTQSVGAPIFFEQNSSVLLDKPLSEILNAAQKIKALQPAKIVIEGYSSKNEGGFQKSIDLSNARAKAVKNALIQQIKNIPIITIGYGSAYSKKTKSLIERQFDRRADIILLYED